MPFDHQTRLNLLTAFRFLVMIDGSPMGAFTECALPNIEWEVEEIKEGGLNTYIHQLPSRRKSTKITLKNGIGVTQALLDWYTQSMNESITRRKITIQLLDSKLNAIVTYEIENAYPLKWTGPQLKSDDNSVAIQSLELACGEITVQ